MTFRKAASLVFAFSLLLLSSLSAFAQTQTTGRIAGTIKDQNRAVIVGAEVPVGSKATADERRIKTNREGSYAMPLLPPGIYWIKVTAQGFNSAFLHTAH